MHFGAAVLTVFRSEFQGGQGIFLGKCFVEVAGTLEAAAIANIQYRLICVDQQIGGIVELQVVQER